jgi:hypothetical protein
MEPLDPTAKQLKEVGGQVVRERIDARAGANLQVDVQEVGLSIRALPRRHACDSKAKLRN